MDRELIQTTEAPEAIGAYSQAVRAGGWVWCSGQIGLAPDTMVMADGLEAQTRQVLENLTAVLDASGSSVDQVVRVTIFLTSMDHFGAVNTLYAEWAGALPPARETVAVRELPKGALVEISCVALAPYVGAVMGQE